MAKLSVGQFNITLCYLDIVTRHIERTSPEQRLGYGKSKTRVQLWAQNIDRIVSRQSVVIERTVEHGSESWRISQQTCVTDERSLCRLKHAAKDAGVWRRRTVVIQLSRKSRLVKAASGPQVKLSHCFGLSSYLDVAIVYQGRLNGLTQCKCLLIGHVDTDAIQVGQRAIIGAIVRSDGGNPRNIFRGRSGIRGA